MIHVTIFSEAFHKKICAKIGKWLYARREKSSFCIVGVPYLFCFL